MAWVDQRTWATGDKLRAGWLNTMIRDDLTYLYDPPRVWVSRDSIQSIRAYTTEFLDFPRAVSDPLGMQGCDPAEAAGYSRTVGVTFPRPGRYLAVASFSVIPESTGILVAQVGGAEVVASGQGYVATAVTTSTWETFARIETIITADIDDWILVVTNASCAPVGAQITIPVGYPHKPMLSCHWLGGA